MIVDITVVYPSFIQCETRQVHSLTFVLFPCGLSYGLYSYMQSYKCLAKVLPDSSGITMYFI